MSNFDPSLPIASGNGRPLPVAPPETPEQRGFTEYVDAVRQGGDAFDVHRTRRNIYRMGVSAITGVLGAAWFQAEHVGRSLVTAGLAAGIAGLGTLPITRRLRATDRDAAEMQFNNDAQHAIDAWSDLYRIKGAARGSHEIVLRWAGPINNDQEAEGAVELTRMARLAEAAGVSKMLVGTRLARLCGVDRPPEDTVSMAQWLHANKGLLFRGDIERDMVLEASPAEWLARAKATPDDKTIVRLDVMRSVHPDNAATAVLAPHGRPMLVYEPSNGYRRDIVRAYTPKPLQPAVSYSVQIEHALGRQAPEFAGKAKEVKTRIVAKIMGGLAAGLLLAGGIGGGGDALLDYRNRQAAEQIARENNADPAAAEVDQGSVHQRVDSWHSINWLWREWRGARKALHEWNPLDGGRGGGSSKGKGEDMANTSLSMMSGIAGNVDKESKSPIWRLTPHNMSDEQLRGHWTQSTSHTLKGYLREGEPFLYWDTVDMYTVPESEDIFMPLAVAHEPNPLVHDRWIKVQGSVGPRDRIEPDIGRRVSIQVPVLDGTRPIAAQLDGEPVIMRRNADNTYAITLPPERAGDAGPLEYWLAPSNPHDPKGPIALKNWDFRNDAGVDKPLTYDPERVMEVYNEYAPELDGASPRELEQYLQKNFKYRLAPWPDSKKAKDVDDMLRQTFTWRRANCNVAAFTMALAFPELNPVFEFNNTADARTLSANEAHARLVDKRGASYDPTPPLPLKPKGEGSPPPAPVPFATIGAFAVSLVGGVWVFRKRPAIARRGRRTIDWAWNAALERNAGTLRAARIAADYAIWRRDDQNGTSELTLRHLNEGRADTSVSARQAFRDLQDPARHSRDVARIVRSQPHVTPSMLRALRIARYMPRKR